MRIFLLSIILLSGVAVYGQRPAFMEKIFVGADISPGGNNSLESISGFVMGGYKITNAWSAGAIVPVIYNFTNDLTHYGLSPFSRYKILNQYFAHVEFENISIEVPNDDRFLSQALFVGGGMNQPLRGSVSFSLSVLYNLLYDETVVPRIYNRPFVIRGGINLGF